MKFHSGGAKGADYIWTKLANRKNSIPIFIHSFEGHNLFLPLKTFDNVTILKHEDFFLPSDFQKECENLVEKNYPTKKYVRLLLSRTYKMLLDCDLVLGLGFIKEGKIEGGTGWTFAMSSLLGIESYLFAEDSWFHYFSGNLSHVGENLNLDFSKFSNIAGVGSRDANSRMIQEACRCYKQGLFS